MGKQTNGIFGQWSGKVGTLVGSSIYGKGTIRTYRENIANPRSAGQVAQRTKFSNCNDLALQINNEVLIPMWKRFAVGMSQINSFVKANIGAFDASGEPSFEDLKMSQGRLLAPTLTGIDHESTTSVSVSCTLPNDPYGLGSDAVYAVICQEDLVDGKIKVLFAGDTGSIRSDVEADNYITIEAGGAASLGEDQFIYVMFRRADGSYVSDSGVYHDQD
jgi:hypothetical protein